MKYFILILTFAMSLFSLELKPYKEIKFDGIVKDLVVRGDKLIAGTDTGKLQVYDLKQDKIVKTIQLPKIKDFMGDIVDTRVASVDYIDGRYLLLSDSGIGGYFNVWIHENNETKKIISHEDKKSLVKARFVDKDNILLGYLSNDIGLYNIPQKKELYKVQISESKFSDFALDKDRKTAAISCESGIIYLLDTKTGKILKELKSEHVDNVYKVDIKNGKVSGAGQDRRGSIYNLSSNKADHLNGTFLIYATGLSPSGEKVAFAMDEENNIYIYSTLTKSLLAKLKGQKSTLNSIVFKDENTLFSASDDETVMMWKLDK